VPDAKSLQYRLVERLAEDSAGERERVIAALVAPAASISPKYFYDDLGCALYGAICRLPEYYPTRTEAAIFREHRAEIAATLGSGRQFVDLGAGDCCKALAWLPFVEPARYIAVDIARAEIERSLAKLSPDFPEVEMIGVITDFTRGLALQDVLDARPVTFFYPGSSIGNFSPDEAARFLASIRAHGGGLLIGVDAKKDHAQLAAAYDDPLGVTAAFNLNVLRHLNQRFGFDFRVDGFRHLGFYNEGEGRIEMHLESRGEQDVRLGDRQRHFAAGERIHTENSYKYRAPEFERLLRAAGYTSIRRWSNLIESFFVFYAQ
jgi:dimethylhistidine N-methyltransferase